MNNELAKNGFFYKDLDQVSEVLELIHDGLKNDKVCNLNFCNTLLLLV